MSTLVAARLYNNCDIKLTNMAILKILIPPNPIGGGVTFVYFVVLELVSRFSCYCFDILFQWILWHIV